MKNGLLDLFINPYSGNELKRESDFLVDKVTEERRRLLNNEVSVKN